jgi:hypothetical protein
MSRFPVSQPVPAATLLQSYCQQPGAFTDAYVLAVARPVSLGDLITAFYNSPVFRPERWLLGALLGRRADNTAVARLAAGEVTQFSAWTVEARCTSEILLCDFQGRTRSWLMVEVVDGGTRLHFGSAVVARQDKASSAAFRLLVGFHKAYSRALLWGAARNLT